MLLRPVESTDQVFLAISNWPPIGHLPTDHDGSRARAAPIPRLSAICSGHVHAARPRIASVSTSTQLRRIPKKDPGLGVTSRRTSAIQIPQDPHHHGRKARRLSRPSLHVRWREAALRDQCHPPTHRPASARPHRVEWWAILLRAHPNTSISTISHRVSAGHYPPIRPVTLWPFLAGKFLMRRTTSASSSRARCMMASSLSSSPRVSRRTRSSLGSTSILTLPPS